MTKERGASSRESCCKSSTTEERAESGGSEERASQQLLRKVLVQDHLEVGREVCKIPKGKEGSYRRMVMSWRRELLVYEQEDLASGGKAILSRTYVWGMGGG